MSHRGLGAPLIALSDYIIFGDSGIMTLNIGGIANITYLGKEGTIAFDTGPGNMLIDQAMAHFFGLSMDKDGRVARTGNIDDKLLIHLMKDAYLEHPLPKNSGREYYGSTYLSNLIKKFPWLKKEDFIRTLTRFTAASIYDQAKRFLPVLPSEIVVGGGGSRNTVLMSDLKTLFEGRVETFKDKGIDDEFREALGFAILANQTIHHAAGRIIDPEIMSGP
ncbi:anhydro-N-acetylmuramic acid kinase, partial [mine drainage metagenome]